MTDHPETVNERMDVLLESLASKEAAAGARRLVRERRAEWGRAGGDWVLFRSSDDVALLEVYEQDGDYSSTHAFWKEVER